MFSSVHSAAFVTKLPTTLRVVAPFWFVSKWHFSLKTVYKLNVRKLHAEYEIEIHIKRRREKEKLYWVWIKYTYHMVSNTIRLNASTFITFLMKLFWGFFTHAFHYGTPVAWWYHKLFISTECLTFIKFDGGPFACHSLRTSHANRKYLPKQNRKKEREANGRVSIYFYTVLHFLFPWSHA